MSNYDKKGNASHYSDNRINAIRMFESIWGTEATMKFCEMNAFKYRLRLGKKDDVNLEMKKVRWYEAMALFLKERLDSGFIHGGIPDSDCGMFKGFDEFLKSYTNE